MLNPDIVYIGRHDSSIEPVGDQTTEGLAMPRLEYLQWISDRYDAGEKVHDMVIVNYQTIRAIWDSAMKTGDFSQLSDDFFDSLAAVEVLIQRDRVVDRYVDIFDATPKPILSRQD